jgi:hypothetical protein
MKWKLVVAMVLMGATVAMAQEHQWDMNKAYRKPFLSNTVFTNHPDSATGNSVEPANSANIYLGKANIDTTTSIGVGPWRRLVLWMRIDGSNTESDDSVDTNVMVDVSWDGTNWSPIDTNAITDTLWHAWAVDSTAGLTWGAFIRLRPDPVSGMRQDTVGTRPYLNASVIYK